MNIEGLAEIQEYLNQHSDFLTEEQRKEIIDFTKDNEESGEALVVFDSDGRTYVSLGAYDLESDEELAELIIRVE